MEIIENIFLFSVFKAAPASPPSAAADLGAALDSNFMQSLKKLMTNRNYILLLISYGLNIGVFYAISTLLNELVLRYYPVSYKTIYFFNLYFKTTYLLRMYARDTSALLIP